jgi:DNA-binding transcriptional regulator YhcF (GntR family)
MDLTSCESQVVQLLRQRQVAAYGELAQQLNVSGKTVQRALHKAGAYASLNANSAYVTLKDTPRFDSRGLWHYEQLRFSRHGGLRRTIQALIEQSSQGCTLEELQQWLGTRLHNHISLLLRGGKIQRFFLGRHAVYTSADPAQQKRQQAARQPSATTTGGGLAAHEAPPLPPGMQPMDLIRLLLRMLQQPAASPASLAKSLQAQGVAIHAAEVRAVMTLYGLKKTTP